MALECNSCVKHFVYNVLFLWRTDFGAAEWGSMHVITDFDCIFLKYLIVLTKIRRSTFSIYIQNGFHGLNDELTERAQLKRISSCFSTNRTIYDYMVENLNTSFTDLTAYQGRVLLIVNTATYCGTGF